MSQKHQTAGAKEINTNYLPAVVIKWAFKNPYRNCRECVPQGSDTATFAHPFSIGKTRWQLEFRLPSKRVWLKRVRSDNDGKEELSFQLTYASTERKNKFTYTAANQEKCIFNARGIIIHLLDAEYVFTFEAFVRPDNYASGLPCDFRVVVLDKNDEEKEIAEFAAHRSILLKGSPVFKAMLADDSKFKEAKEGLLKIGNFSPETVKALLVYIYTGNEKLVDEKSYSEAMELLDAIEQYQLAEVFKKQCCVRLLKLIDCGNALGLLATAERYRWDKKQKQAVMEFIRKKRSEIILPLANDEALKRLPFETLVELLKVVAQK